MVDPSVRLTFLTDPQDFLTAAADLLAADPVLSTVVATVTSRLRDQLTEGTVQSDDRQWWVVVHDASGRVVGAAMRTAPSPPYPPYLMPMPTQAAELLAVALCERGEDVGGVNGALPAIRVFADTYAALSGADVSVGMHTRLFELGELNPPAPVPGRLRAADDQDLDLALDWFDAFGRAADEQAGRPAGTHSDTGVGQPDPDGILRRIRAGRLWFWEDDLGNAVHLTGANPPAFGVARIGPVYTPREFRRRGFAGAAVAEVSAILSANGERVCLFTDQANPTSNKLYQALGYRPVVDMANLRISGAERRQA
jgi:ribosomal protein S18 acetylase RimI-like enzyme